MNRSNNDTLQYNHVSGSNGSNSGGAPLPDAQETHIDELKLLNEVRNNKTKKHSKHAHDVHNMKTKEEEALWIAKQLANQRALASHEQMINAQLDMMEQQLNKVNESEEEDDFEKHDDEKFVDDSDEDLDLDLEDKDETGKAKKDKNNQSENSKRSNGDDKEDGTLDEDGLE